MKSLFLLLIVVASAFGNEPVAFIKNLNGEATLIRDNASRPLKKGEYLMSNDELKTAKNTNVGVSFNDGTRIALGSNSHFKIDAYLFAPAQNNFRFDMTLTKGTALMESGKIGKLAPQKVSLKAPQGIIGIRGTKFIVEIQ